MAKRHVRYAIVRKILKLSAVLSLVLVFTFVGICINLYAMLRPDAKRPWMAIWTRKVCMTLCKVLGVRVSVVNHSGHMFSSDKKAQVLVANHMSYLDVFVLYHLDPICFVTSTDIKKSFGLGHFCRLAGCLFVNRKKINAIQSEISEISSVIHQGIFVGIFPEATSSNAQQVLPFKPALLQCVANTNTRVTPITINYRKIDGEPVRNNNRDLVCWYGDMDFAPHLWNLLGVKSIEASLDIGEQIVCVDLDRKNIAEQAYSQITKTFVPVIAQSSTIS